MQKSPTLEELSIVLEINVSNNSIEQPDSSQSQPDGESFGIKEFIPFMVVAML